MNIKSLDLEAEFQRLKSGDFEAAMVMMDESIEDRFGLAGYFGENSIIGYSNPRLIGLLRKALASMNPDDREKLFSDLVPILQADLPLTYLYPNVWTAVADRRIRGLDQPHFACVQLAMQNLEDLWLED